MTKQLKQDYITSAEAASILGRDHKFLSNDRYKTKRIPFIKSGKSILYKKEDVVAYKEVLDKISRRKPKTIKEIKIFKKSSKGIKKEPTAIFHGKKGKATHVTNALKASNLKLIHIDPNESHFITMSREIQIQCQETQIEISNLKEDIHDLRSKFFELNGQLIDQPLEVDDIKPGALIPLPIDLYKMEKEISVLKAQVVDMQKDIDFLRADNSEIQAQFVEDTSKGFFSRLFGR